MISTIQQICSWVCVFVCRMYLGCFCLLTVPHKLFCVWEEHQKHFTWIPINRNLANHRQSGLLWLSTTTWLQHIVQHCFMSHHPPPPMIWRCSVNLRLCHCSNCPSSLPRPPPMDLRCLSTPNITTATMLLVKRKLRIWTLWKRIP